MARSAFPSQNVQNTPAPDDFWQLRCRKSAHRCGAKHFSKSKQISTPWSDYFWKLRCRKSARRCGAKHISKSKCTKENHVRTTFGGSDVKKVHAVVARSTFRSQNVKNTRGSDHYTTLHYITLHYTTVHYTTLHSTTLHYATLHYTTFHYTPLH